MRDAKTNEIIVGRVVSWDNRGNVNFADLSVLSEVHMDCLFHCRDCSDCRIDCSFDCPRDCGGDCGRDCNHECPSDCSRDCDDCRHDCATDCGNDCRRDCFVLG